MIPSPIIPTVLAMPCVPPGYLRGLPAPAIFGILARAVKDGARRAAMPAYWVARSKVNDPVQYKKYTDPLPAIFARYGGKVLARGGRFRIMEGPETFGRHIVIEFPTFEQAVACFESKEYQEAAAFRRGGAGIVENVIVEGGDATPR
jgi:uncharacterized protein (DUF1330 family)